MKRTSVSKMHQPICSAPGRIWNSVQQQDQFISVNPTEFKILDQPVYGILRKNWSKRSPQQQQQQGPILRPCRFTAEYWNTFLNSVRHVYWKRDCLTEFCLSCILRKGLSHWILFVMYIEKGIEGLKSIVINNSTIAQEHKLANVLGKLGNNQRA